MDHNHKIFVCSGYLVRNLFIQCFIDTITPSWLFRMPDLLETKEIPDEDYFFELG